MKRLGLIAAVVFAAGSAFADAKTAAFLKNEGVSVTASHKENELKNLFDRNKNNRWSTGSSMKAGMWLQLTFPKAISVSSVKMDSGKSHLDYARGYEIYFSNDGIEWGTPVAEGKGSSAVIDIQGLKGTAKYVKILQTGSNTGWWSVHDLKINGESLAGAKIVVPPKYSSFAVMMNTMRAAYQAENQSATPLKEQTLAEFKRRLPKLKSNRDHQNLNNLFDGTRSNRWTSGRLSSGIYVQIQFGKAIDINSIVMDQGVSVNDSPQEYKVMFSENGKKWNEVAAGKGTPEQTVIDNLTGSAKFIKIVETSERKSNWSIHDLIINGVSLAYDSFDMKEMWAEYPVQTTWLTQDAVRDREAARMDSKYNVSMDIFDFFKAPAGDEFEYFSRIMDNVLEDLGSSGKKYRKKLEALLKKNVAATDSRWFELYEAACKERRRVRLKPLLAKTKQIVFAKRPVYGGIFYINETSGTDHVSELGSIDLTSEMDGEFAEVSTFLDSNGGMMRDPELSYDGKKMLFAWRKTTKNIGSRVWAPDTGNYQIYEMELTTKKVRQLTTDETYGANKEPLYLPDGNILFNSQRIVQHITCGWGDCSNFHLMDKDGNYQRRIGFDQTNTVDPVVINDGRVLYLRRDYNDRGQSSAHALFQMRPDGTNQTEYYGNQTGTPNSFQQPAPIPGSNKIAIVLGGYHHNEGGQLAIMDIHNGRQNADGLVRIPQGDAPPTKPGHDDGYAKEGIQYSWPHPISEHEFIVCRSETWGKSSEQYRIYFMNTKGERELLASDPDTSCMQPVAVRPRKKPSVRPTMVDYKKKNGVFYVQNVYKGSASEGIEAGSIKKLRIVEILYKHDTINSGKAAGPGGAWDTVTATGHGLASFDSKKILGEATVHKDGSAMFEVPARKPVYFQMLDDKNRVVQTMRSWTTLMPGEKFSCVGCHEGKNDTPVMGGKITTAFKKGVEKLKPFYGKARAFSYLKEVQPVFDKHCVKCHKAGKDGGDKLLLTAQPFIEDSVTKRRFATSYVKLAAARPRNPEEYKVQSGIKEWVRRGPAMADEPNKYVNYMTRFELMGPQKPYRAGSITSGMVKKLEEGHGKVSKEGLDKIKAWIDLNLVYAGEYDEPDASAWTDKDKDLYSRKIAERKRNEEIEAKALAKFIKAGQ